MNTLIFVGLFMCVFVAYTSALPYPSEDVAEIESKGEELVAIDTKSEGESLVPAESAWHGHGWGHGGGRGWGHGGHGDWGHGGGWGHGRGWGHGGGWGHGVGWGHGGGWGHFGDHGGYHGGWRR